MDLASLLAWWPHAVAFASLLLAASQQQGDSLAEAVSAKFGAAGRAALALAPRLALLSWLLAGLLAWDPEGRLCCAVLLASAPRQPRREAGACLALLLARSAACGDGLASLWLPCFLFVQCLLTGEAGGLSLRGAGLGLPGRGSSASDVSDKVVKRFPNWSAPTGREVKAFAKGFGIRSQLLAVYDCTVHLQIEHQGYLYLSRTHICFQAVNLVTRGLQIVVGLDDVKEIISGSRDAATLVLKRNIHLRARQPVLSAIELRGCESGSAAIAALLSRQDEDEDDGDDGDDSAPEGAAQESRAAATSSSPSDATSERVQATFDSNNGNPFHRLFEAHIPGLHLGPLGEELLAAEWTPSNLVMQHLAKQGAWDVAPAPWIDDEGAEATPSHAQAAAASALKLREVTMQMPVPPAPMCPASTRMTTTFCVKVTPCGEQDATIELQTSSISHEVPFGNKFLVQELVQLDPAEGGALFRKSTRVVFLKSCGMFQSRIRSSSASQCAITAEHMAALLQARATPAMDMSPSAQAARTTCTVHIFELQRRVTLWSRSWLPPFLPHDGRKRWRWVDTSYQVHSWTSASSREEAQACPKPPIAPGPGWSALAEWEVVYTDGDAEGWQYAIDFYHKPKYWGKTPAGCHVRRRLWYCVFVEAAADAAQGDE